MTKPKAGSAALTLLAAFAFLLVAGITPFSIVSLHNSANVEAQTETCIETIDGSTTVDAVWDTSCLSDKPSEQGGDRYARFYTFSLDYAARVSISLTSDEDTHLYLLKGAGRSGEAVDENDDIDREAENYNSHIEVDLDAGAYTIEATTYYPEMKGDFKLEVIIESEAEPTATPTPPPTPEPTPPPTPEPTAEAEPTVTPTREPPSNRYVAINSGANHVCALAADGSIMCWGDDSEGQVSGRPASGAFTAISCGDNHTCALRDDGAVICWGSLSMGPSLPSE
jgi:hypothetical protein